MKAKTYFLAALAMVFALTCVSCVGTDDYDTDDETDVNDDKNDNDNSDTTAAFNTSSTIKIAFTGSSATIDGANDSVSVVKSGAGLTVTSTATGICYDLSGSTTSGYFKIYSDKKFQIKLDGVSIKSATGSAINSQSSKKCSVVLVGGTTNTLTDAASYSTPSTEDEKGCFFSEGQLIFSGSGSLKVTGNYKHGICSDDYIIIDDGPAITIASAVKDGLHALDYFEQDGGTLNVTASSDGIDCEDGYIIMNDGILTASTAGTAKKCVKAESYIDINGGTLTLNTTGGGEYDSTDKDVAGAACIKCGGDFTFDNATATLKSTGAGGKGINIDGKATFNSGVLNVTTTGQQYSYGSTGSAGGFPGGGQSTNSNSTGAKGIKSDGDMTINGGTITVSTTGGEGSEGIEGKANIIINDGVVSVTSYDDGINAGTKLTVNGGQVCSYATNNDAIDSNGSFLFTGGLTIALGTTTPECGFDCDQSNFAITGGTLIGFGGDTSVPTSGSCTQRSVVYYSVPTGSLLALLNSAGANLFTYNLARTYSSATMLYSSPSLASGSTFTLYSGGSVTSGTTLFNTYTIGGTYAAGTAKSSFTTSSMVTTVGTGGGTGGGGGRPGGW